MKEILLLMVFAIILLVVGVQAQQYCPLNITGTTVRSPCPNINGNEVLIIKKNLTGQGFWDALCVNDNDDRIIQHYVLNQSTWGRNLSNNFAFDGFLGATGGSVIGADAVYNFSGNNSYNLILVDGARYIRVLSHNTSNYTENLEARTNQYNEILNTNRYVEAVKGFPNSNESTIFVDSKNLNLEVFTYINSSWINNSKLKTGLIDSQGDLRTLVIYNLTRNNNFSMLRAPDGVNKFQLYDWNGSGWSDATVLNLTTDIAVLAHLEIVYNFNDSGNNFTMFRQNFAGDEHVNLIYFNYGNATTQVSVNLTKANINSIGNISFNVTPQCPVKNISFIMNNSGTLSTPIINPFTGVSLNKYVVSTNFSINTTGIFNIISSYKDVNNIGFDVVQQINEAIPPEITLINLTSEGGLGQIIDLNNKLTGSNRTNDTTPSYFAKTNENSNCSIYMTSRTGVLVNSSFLVYLSLDKNNTDDGFYNSRIVKAGVPNFISNSDKFRGYMELEQSGATKSQIRITDKPYLTHNFTQLMWGARIKPARNFSTTNTGYIIHRRNNLGGIQNFRDYSLFFSYATNTTRCEIFNGSAVVTATSNDKQTSNEEYNVLCLFDNKLTKNNFQMWILNSTDFTIIKNITVQGTIWTNTSDTIYIGGFDTGNSPYNGTIQEVFIINESWGSADFSSNESIRQLMVNGIVPNYNFSRMIGLNASRAGTTTGATTHTLTTPDSDSVNIGLASAQIACKDSSGNENLTSTSGLFYVNITDTTTPPIVNVSISNISPKRFDLINISANITDETGLLNANITINFSAGKVFKNYTISDIFTIIYNITNITDSRGNVLNITVYATDVNNNVRQNSTLITVANTIPIVVNISTITPDPLQGGNTAKGHANYTDSDNDVAGGNQTYWYINNTLLNEANNSFTLLGGNITANANITFSARFNDTFDWSLWVNSSTFTVGDNIAPSIVSANWSSISITNGDQINITINAIDNNNLNQINITVLSPSGLLFNRSCLNINKNSYICNITFFDGDETPENGIWNLTTASAIDLSANLITIYPNSTMTTNAVGGGSGSYGGGGGGGGTIKTIIERVSELPILTFGGLTLIDFPVIATPRKITKIIRFKNIGNGTFEDADVSVLGNAKIYIHPFVCNVELQECMNESIDIRAGENKLLSLNGTFSYNIQEGTEGIVRLQEKRIDGVAHDLSVIITRPPLFRIIKPVSQFALIEEIASITNTSPELIALIVVYMGVVSIGGAVLILLL